LALITLSTAPRGYKFSPPDGNFRVGVHIADVTSFIKKGDYVDVEAYERATTFYPGQGRNPYHMLPEPMSTNLCRKISIPELKPSLALITLSTAPTGYKFSQQIIATKKI
jgi:exoribonuclease II